MLMTLCWLAVTVQAIDQQMAIIFDNLVYVRSTPTGWLHALPGSISVLSNAGLSNALSVPASDQGAGCALQTCFSVRFEDPIRLVKSSNPASSSSEVRFLLGEYGKSGTSSS